MMHRKKTTQLRLASGTSESIGEGMEEVSFRTNEGVFPGIYHPAPFGKAAVVWVGGAGGGLHGPAGGLYPRLAQQLVGNGIASLRIHYRHPGYLEECVQDTQIAIQYLATHQRTRIALVGHSFGGAVVITAGAIREEVVLVVAMSSQTYGTSRVPLLSPRSLLLMHGTADEILPDDCSHDLYRRARQPKEIILYPGCRHGLDECRQEVDRNLLDWLRDQLGNRAGEKGVPAP